MLNNHYVAQGRVISKRVWNENEENENITFTIVVDNMKSKYDKANDGVLVNCVLLNSKRTQNFKDNVKENGRIDISGYLDNKLIDVNGRKVLESKVIVEDYNIIDFNPSPYAITDDMIIDAIASMTFEEYKEQLEREELEKNRK